MPDRVVLAFDTSAAHCAAALLSGGKVIATRAEPMHKGQAERLMPMLEEVLAEGGHTWGDLDVIGVGIGPGNFTGTRIAVSAARGLALGLQIPAVGVSAFEAAALGKARPLAVTVPAARGQVYVQVFADDATAGSEVRLSDGLDTDHPVADALPPHELAIAVARIALDRRGTEPPRPAPLYIRPADAAPPREAPPTILP